MKSALFCTAPQAAQLFRLQVRCGHGAIESLRGCAIARSGPGECRLQLRRCASPRPAGAADFLDPARRFGHRGVDQRRDQPAPDKLLNRKGPVTDDRD